jgi:hypothetical protein
MVAKGELKVIDKTEPKKKGQESGIKNHGNEPEPVVSTSP